MNVGPNLEASNGSCDKKIIIQATEVGISRRGNKGTNIKSRWRGKRIRQGRVIRSRPQGRRRVSLSRQRAYVRD